MRTISFHSIKGGVGRTLALNNFAQLLIKRGNKVLLLDFDYTAPGLHYKYDNISSQDGYIEYLRDTPLKTRISNRYKDQKKCRDSLKNKIIQIDKKERLYLLTAGNDQEVDYWTYISSFSFHRLFYFASKEIAGLSYASFDDQQLTDNKEAFEQDKEYLERTHNFDYLLVDCKSSMETSAVPLLFWSDTIVHLFPYNKEGLNSLTQTKNAIKYHNKRYNNSDINFIPVTSRVSLSSDYEEIKRKEKDLFILSEHYHIETNERILFKNDDKNDLKWKLSHDYIELFAKVLDEKKDTLMKSLNMDEDNIIYSHNLEYHKHLGILRNSDDKPNISFRIDTFHKVIYNLIKEIINKDDVSTEETIIESSLKETGKIAAEDFVKDFKQDNHNIKDKRELIEKWVKFDSEVGFGTMKLIEFEARGNNYSGIILVIGDAFKNISATNQHDLRYIFSGYMETVLDKLLETEETELIVKFENINNTKTQYSFIQKNKDKR